MTTPAPAAPALVVPCDRLAARLSPDGSHAELALLNAVVHASVILDAEQLASLVDQLAALRDSLDPAAAGLSLVTPASAGKLVGPNGSAL